MASSATKQGSACPRRVSMNKTEMIKMFLWAQQDKHGTPGRDVWTESTGLGIAAASGHESAAIWRAWVSGDPAGMSQRRSGGHWVRGGPAGIESAAIRWRDLPRTARLRRITPAIGGHEGIAAIGLAALAAIPPNSHALLQWAMAGLRAATSLPRDRQTGTK